MHGEAGLRRLRCLHNLLRQRPDARHVAVVSRHAAAVVSDANSAIQNRVDRERLNAYFREINTLLTAININRLYSGTSSRRIYFLMQCTEPEHSAKG